LGIGDLSALAALTGLRSLRMLGLQAARDLSPLAGLTGLRRLEVSRAGIEESDLVRPDSLRPLAGLDQLEELLLDGAVVADGDLSPLVGLPALRRLRLYAPPAGPAPAALPARPEPEPTIVAAPGGAAEIRTGLPTRPPVAGDQWWLRADLTDHVDADTNADAERVVLAAVAAQDAALAGRLSTDTEADAVQISAANPDDLRTVAAIIARLAATNR